MNNDPLAWIDDESSRRAVLGLTRRLVPRDRTLVNFGTNDYLGLAADPRLAEAAISTTRSGWGAGASPLVAGWTDRHQSLVEALAAFEQAEAVALFPTGYAANLGTVAALVAPGDAVYADRLNHACLIDGARLSGARLRVYPHNDTAKLAAILDRDRGRFRRSLIATDGVFSMDGDLAPLPELARLADDFGAILLVDEAHGTGVFGPDGRGACSALGVTDRVHVRVGTLSKALGSIGGFVAGSRRLIDHLINRARPLIYSTALPAAAAAAAIEALTVVQDEPWRRERIFLLGDRLRLALRGAGHNVPASTGPIVPVVLGESAAAVAISERLRARGLFVPAIRPPTVPADSARLRISLSARHTDADLDSLIQAMADSPAIS